MTLIHSNLTQKLKPEIFDLIGKRLLGDIYQDPKNNGVVKYYLVS